MARPCATLEDLYQVQGKAELIDGEIVEFMPTGRMPKYAADAVMVSLWQYAKQTRSGVAVGDNAGFAVHLPHRESFSPDAAFYVGPNTGMKFFQGAPLFAVEVRGENDYGPLAEKQISEKRRDYFATETKVVWDVDLQSADVLRKYTSDAPDTSVIFRRGEVADAEPALPGWRIAVDDLFEPETVEMLPDEVVEEILSAKGESNPPGRVW